MKLNNKAFTVVELLASFAIISVILVAMFGLIFSLTDSYENASVGSDLITTQAVLQKKIADDFRKDKIISLTNCGDRCLDITYQAAGKKRFLVNQEGNTYKITYGNFTKTLVKDSYVEKPTVTNATIPNVSEHHFNTMITFNIPIKHNSVKGDYGIHLVYQYDNRKYTLSSFGEFTSDPDANKKAWRKADISKYGSGNIPSISSGMIPVYYGSKNDSKQWYDYNEQQWANVVTVSNDTRATYNYAPIGTELNMTDISTMYTWIPRFRYKLFNVSETVSPVGNPNMVADYTIDVALEDKNTPKSEGTNNGEWLTHPAFTFGSEELDGFWVGKFELGYNQGTDPTTYTEGAGKVNSIDTNKVIVKPNVVAWRGNTYSNFYQSIKGMNGLTNIFGLSSTDDSHMMKNMEWGAMVYLTNSMYGKAGNTNYVGIDKFVKPNNNSSYKTGCAAKKQLDATSAACDAYDSGNGISASTTGNITGIYDTAGGAWDGVMATLKDLNGSDTLPTNSGFTQNETNTLGKEGKYLDIYDHGTVETDRSRGKLGDATKEMGPFNTIYMIWGNNWANFPIDNSVGYTWFVRGGSIVDPTGIQGNPSFRYGPGAHMNQVGTRSIIITK